MTKTLRCHMRQFRQQNQENNAKKPDSNPGLRPNILRIFVALISSSRYNFLCGTKNTR